MIGISVKEDRVNFLSAFYSKSEIVINDFGILPLKSQKFDSEIIEKIINRKKIKNSNIVSKKCMICIDSSEVIFNQISTSEKVDMATLIDWNNRLIFNDAKIDRYKDLHYQICPNNDMLSIYVDKNIQSEYYNYCKKSNLKISCLSIDIFSADYLARNMFDAESSSDYIVWGVGKNKDDMMIVQNNNFAGLVSFKRFKNSLEIIKCIGSEEYMLNCLNKISHKGFTDFKSVDFVKKIYMYQKCQNSDMKKIVKSNKEDIVILNPLLKIDSFKKRRNEDINSSFLSEMGYLFKIIKEKGQISD